MMLGSIFLLPKLPCSGSRFSSSTDLGHFKSPKPFICISPKPLFSLIIVCTDQKQELITCSAGHGCSLHSQLKLTFVDHLCSLVFILIRSRSSNQQGPPVSLARASCARC